MCNILSFSICFLAICLGQDQPIENISSPPLVAEITADHPLFLFTCSIKEIELGTANEKIKNVWNNLDDELKPFSALWLDFYPELIRDPGKLEDVLNTIFQEFKCPVVLKIPTIMKQEVCPEHRELEALFARFPNIIGISIHDFTMNLYPSYSHDFGLDYSHVLWLSKMIQVLASYGRFLYWSMDSIEWARYLSHPESETLFNIMKSYPEYVIPAYRHNGDTAPIGIGEMLGLYLTNSVSCWGIICSSEWYHKDFIVKPCLFGKAPEGTISIPNSFYRLMILNGVLAGATVFAFENEDALWLGKENSHWKRTINPTLKDIISSNPIPQRNMLLQQVKSAFQLYPSSNPLEFHKNLKELNPQMNEGKIVQTIYGDPSSGKLPLIIPENGNAYIIPILSSFLSAEQTHVFEEIVGYRPSHPEWTWTQVLSTSSKPVGEGNAFITSAGKWVFIFNSNIYSNTPQTYQIMNMPAPVRKFTANRVQDGIVLKWPFREGDISYQIYRRFPPDTSFHLLAKGIDAREWKDTSISPQQTIAYSITALTSEQEPISGTVSLGDYLMFSTVESKIVEEVVLSPETFTSESVPILSTALSPEEFADCKDPMEGLELTQKEQAEVILKNLALFESAIISKNIDSLINLFAPNYKDSAGRGADYLRAGFEWFFMHCPYPKMIWQVRQWLFETSPENQTLIKVSLFLKVKGYALSDSLGIKGDIPIEIYSENGGETTITWSVYENQWRIINIEPPILEIKKISSTLTSPYFSTNQ
ncbi:MAG TPA: hypothetical protein PLT82_05100 [Candidatus Hydrogenedens sp.]|nr:hypothetical protein [Candidatus Hydrogenedens sp.]HOL18712.1 hypothetical protein [Candidatus Hydrogenedens sp.]HPP58491.1 hypothetical protein [Candidatus Hydrogenedens sp.]